MLVLEGACCSESAMQNSGMGRLGDKTEEELKVEGVMKTALNILLHDQRSEHEAVKIVTLLIGVNGPVILIIPLVFPSKLIWIGWWILSAKNIQTILSE